MYPGMFKPGSARSGTQHAYAYEVSLEYSSCVKVQSCFKRVYNMCFVHRIRLSTRTSLEAFALVIRQPVMSMQTQHTQITCIIEGHNTSMAIMSLEIFHLNMV